MAVYELNNGKIAIKIASKGAELISLQKVNTQTEYMWSGDAKYWGRISPILFPFVGGVKNRQYQAKGKTYTMAQHGFARDMEFQLVSQTAHEIWLEIHDNETTLSSYPYKFQLQVGYRLEEESITVLWRVMNKADEILYFSIGGHPAFLCPLNQEEKQTDCFIQFDVNGQVSATRINQEGLATDQKDIYSLKDGKLAITDHLFDRDALVIEENQSHEVSFCHKNGDVYLKTKFQAPLFGIWAPAGKQAPFICIEPWYGRCDHENFSGTLEDRTWGNELLPGGTWEADYTIEV